MENAHSLMLEALKLAEWGGTAVSRGSRPSCPVCGELQADGHTEHCTMAAAIREGEKAND